MKKSDVIKIDRSLLKEKNNEFVDLFEQMLNKQFGQLLKEGKITSQEVENYINEFMNDMRKGDEK